MADRLLDKVAPLIRQVDKVPYPGSDHDVGLLQLVCGEVMDAEIDAIEYLKKRGIDPDATHAQELVDKENDVQLILRMLVEPDSKGQEKYRLFKNANEVRSRVSPFQRMHFIRLHLNYQNEAMKLFKWPEVVTEENNK